MIHNKSVSNLLLDASFDSGNLLDASLIRHNHPLGGEDVDTVLLQIAPDPHSSVRGWFFFSASGFHPSETVRFCIAPYSNQVHLVSGGWRPYYSLVGPSGPWSMLKQPAVAAQEAQPDKSGGPLVWTLHFRFTAPAVPCGPVYFAFAPPYPLSSIAAQLQAVLGTWGNACTGEEGAQGVAGPHSPSTRLYCASSTLAHSLHGQPVPLLVLTSCRGVDWEGARLGLGGGQGGGGPMPHMPCKAAGKRACVVSARVHPGETPGSYMLDGIVGLLTRGLGDPRTRALLDGWVWYILPCLNPDGVQRGHYRLDTLGANLNRFYRSPSPSAQPSIHAIKSLLLTLASDASPCPLALFLDLHAHAGRRGVWCFGNDLLAPEMEASLHAASVPRPESLPSFPAQCAIAAYPRCIGLYSGWFDPSLCLYTTAGGQEAEEGSEGDKEGTGRVAIAACTGMPLCYTVEAHYSSAASRGVGVVPPAVGDGGKSSPPVGSQRPSGAAAPSTFGRLPSTPSTAAASMAAPGPLGPLAWAEVGRAAMYGWLDMQGVHPWSRLPRSSYRTLSGLHKAAGQEVATSARERLAALRIGQGQASVSATLLRRPPSLPSMPAGRTPSKER